MSSLSIVIPALNEENHLGYLLEDLSRQTVLVSERRFVKYGVLRTLGTLVLMCFVFTLGKFKWTNRMDYEFGNYER